MKTSYLILALMAVLFACTPPVKKPLADTVITNAKLWTSVDSSWATAIAFSGDSILAVGSDSLVMTYSGPKTKSIDAKGRFGCAGFIDSHLHTIMGGQRLASVKLRTANTPAEFAKRIGEYAKTLKKGEWIIGGDWDHTLWGGELPKRAWIDSVTPNNPVWVTRLDGHMHLANTLAMEIAGISDSLNLSIEGGYVDLQDDQKPAGIFKDNAVSFVFNHIPAPTQEQDLVAFEAAMDYFLTNGVTTLHHMTEPEGRNIGGTGTDLDIFEAGKAKGILKVRSYVSVPITSHKYLAEKISKEGRGDSWLKIGALKGYSDGSLGSHSAYFHDHYTDAPEDNGVKINTEDSLFKWFCIADSLDLQLNIHAIGDKGIGRVLDVLERVVERNGQRDRRFTIEHAQHMASADFKRFKTLGVIASMQPYHAIDDGRWAEQYIGSERIKTTYAFRSFLDEGVPLAFGSDWFVAPASPVWGIYAAVTRATLDDKNNSGWVPEQKITVAEALNAYTIHAAFTMYEENSRGSLEAGKLADLVFLDQNPFEIDPMEIKNVKVLETIIGGKVVFSDLD